MNFLQTVRPAETLLFRLVARTAWIPSFLLMLLFAVALMAKPAGRSADQPAATAAPANHAIKPNPGAHGNALTSPASPAAKARLLAGDRKLPLRFESNNGQSDDRVRFLARDTGYTLFLTRKEAVLSLQESQPVNIAQQVVADPSQPAKVPGTAAVLRMQLLGSAAQGSVRGLHALPGRSNYLLGNNPQKWQKNVAAYASVQLEDVYPGIDLVYHGNQGQLEYDFNVAAGADPRTIALRFAGASHVSVDASSGDLVLKVASQEVRFHQPVAYQEKSQSANGLLSASEPSLVSARYVVDARNRVTFKLGPYDRSQPLVIDPTLSYSTYLGGSADDFATSIAVDAAGSVYISGYTSSANFPTTTGAFQTSCAATCGTTDAFVTKLDPAGSSVIYSTYIGGSRSDLGYGIALDASGDAFLVGQTSSTDFPVTPGALQTTCGNGTCTGGDAFVTELDPTGSTLIYSTYFGGSNIDQANAVVVDAQNNAFITGFTQSTNFPTTAGAFQTTCSCATRPDAYVAEINSTGSALVFSTYLGGSVADVAYALVLDPSGNVFVTGYSQSTDFPVTAGAYQTTTGANSAGFVTKLNSTGTALIYSTYLGGTSTITGTSCEACATSIALDGAGDAYVAGLTAESTFPTTPGCFQSTFKSTTKGHDAFITELNPAGSGLVFSTYLGGAGDDGATGIAVDSSGNVWLKGNTKSTDFPVTSGAFQTVSAGNFDHYVAELNPTGTALLFGTYLGGSGIEFGGATKMLAIDSQSPPSVYVTGYSNSTNFPTTPGAFQTVAGGGNDVEISKFIPSPNVGLSPASVNFGSQLVGATSNPQTVTVTNTGNLDLPAPSIVLTGTNSADFSETNTCAATISPQAACTISVTFTPTLFAVENAGITLTDSAANSPQTVSLSGTGIHSGPALSVTPASLTFVKTVILTSSASKTVTLTNTGTDLIAITSLTISGDYSQTNTCGGSIAVGASCTISVIFTPAAINNRTGTVTITDNAPTSPQKVNLSGVGTQVLLSATGLNYGNIRVGASSTQSVNLTNVGTTALSLTKISVTGTAAADYTQTNTCGSSVGAGAACTFTVTFKPSVKGARIASLSITDNGGGSPQSVSLTGQGQ